MNTPVVVPPRCAPSTPGVFNRPGVQVVRYIFWYAISFDITYSVPMAIALRVHMSPQNRHILAISV